MKKTSLVALRVSAEIIDAIDAHAPFSRSVFLRIAAAEKLKRDYGVDIPISALR